MSTIPQVEVTQADRDAAEAADQGAIDVARSLADRGSGATQSEMRAARRRFLAQAFARHRIAPGQAVSAVLNVFSDGSFTIAREGTDAAIAATHDDYVCSIPMGDICARPEGDPM